MKKYRKRVVTRVVVICQVILSFLLSGSFLMPSGSPVALTDSAARGQFFKPQAGEFYEVESKDVMKDFNVRNASITAANLDPMFSAYYTMTRVTNLEIDEGSFALEAETGPNGNVTGSFHFHATGESPWAYDPERDREEFIGFHDVTVDGKITSGKANMEYALTEPGYLRMMGTNDYKNNYRFCGDVTITYYYYVSAETKLDPETGKYFHVPAEDSVVIRENIAHFAATTNFDDTMVFYFSAGHGWGDYGLSIGLEKDPRNLEGALTKYALDFTESADPVPAPVMEEPEPLEEGILEEPEKAEIYEDDETAAFAISLGCDQDVYPEEGIDCGLTIVPVKNLENTPFIVQWILDDYVVKEKIVILGSDSLHVPNPPPGSHSVVVQVLSEEQLKVRVASTQVDVLMPMDGFVTPFGQAAAGAGSVLILLGWLWAEWAIARGNVIPEQRTQQKKDAALEADRRRWYEEQNKLNAEEREMRAKRQEAQDKYQKACEQEWKRFRDELLKVVDKYEKSEYLVDLLDDMQGDAYQNGKWDAKTLRRLEDLINQHLVMDQKADLQQRWKHVYKTLRPESLEKTIEFMNSWTMTGIEVAAGILTFGASELVFMPTRATVAALDARSRALLSGKSGWAAAKEVMVSGGWNVGMNYGFSRVGQYIMKEASPHIMEKIYQRWPDLIPEVKPDLPVVRQSWGNGPQVFVNQPIYKPGPMPVVRLGMENGLRAIGEVSQDLADDVGRMIRNGVEIAPNNTLLRHGERFVLNAQDDIAVKLMNNPGYKRAVEEGLIPNRVQQAVYLTRDKIVKNAMKKAMEEMSGVAIGEKAVSSYIKSVAVTGTGARPLSPQALGRFTDLDGTVMGLEGAGEGLQNTADSMLTRQAEEIFARRFLRNVTDAGVDVGTAEVNMFRGIRENPFNPPVGGYGSRPLTHWTKVDMINRGKVAVSLEHGGMMFDAHPDVAPMRGFGPMEPVPHFPCAPEQAVTDAKRVVLDHLNLNDPSLNKLTILQREGKHVPRVWKTINAGSGRTMPEWMQKLEQLKRNPNTPMSGSSLEQTFQRYSEFLDLSEELRGISS